jgi:hypothetical protein
MLVKVKAKFIWIEFLFPWGNAETGTRHEAGQKTEMRDWIAKALVKRGIAKFLEETS